MTGMAGGYQRVANKARNRAYLWQGITTVAMVGLVGVAVFVLLETLGDEFKWVTLGGRAFILVAFGILAAWAAKQVEKYDEAEARNRRLEMELASLDPYLFGLPDATQHKVKEQLASRLFGQPGSLAKTSGKEVDTSGTTMDVARMALEAALDLLKKSK